MEVDLLKFLEVKSNSTDKNTACQAKRNNTLEDMPVLEKKQLHYASPALIIILRQHGTRCLIPRVKESLFIIFPHFSIH